jgi:dUTPase
MFPLNHILKSGIFSWDKKVNEAWERIKSIISLDIKLTIPQKDEQLVMTCDASKIAISCILWVEKNYKLKVVECFSKLFSHNDSLKSTHFKETYAIVEGFRQFRPFFLSCIKPVVVFTDASSLMWVARNREYSIACNQLANKLAQIKLEIPHIVYSVPSDVNYLADLFSKSFHESRFIDKSHFTPVKDQSNKMPPLTEPGALTEGELYFYFSTPIPSDHIDSQPRKKNKISTPRPIEILYALFSQCTPEQKYSSALCLLQGWNEKNIIETGSSKLNSIQIIQHKNRELYALMCQEMIMSRFYSDLDKDQASRMRSTLMENVKKMNTDKIMDYLKKAYLQHENVLNSLSCDTLPHKSHPSQLKLLINYSLSPGAKYKPRINNNEPSIMLPAQKTVSLRPAEWEVVDTKIRFFIPRDHYGQLKTRQSSKMLEISLCSGILSNDNSNTVKLKVKNYGNSDIKVNEGDYFADLLITSVLNPELFPISTIEMVVKKGLDSEDCLKKEISQDLNIKRLEDSILDIPSNIQRDGLKLPELTPLKSIENKDQCTGSFGSSNVQLNIAKSEHTTTIALIEIETSFLHEICKDLIPTELEISELNLLVQLPSDPDMSCEILNKFKKVENSLILTNRIHRALPQIENYSIKHVETCLDELTNELAHTGGYLKSFLARDKAYLMNNTILNEHERIIKEAAVSNMCQKLALLAVDHIKEQSISKEILSRCQISDDYLNQIYESVRETDNDFPAFHLTKGVLFKRTYDTKLHEYKSGIALPDILLPSVIHNLHKSLGHASVTSTQRNFQSYYYHRKARKFIKEYVKSCVTCVLAGKMYIRKIITGPERTMKPTGPRQCVYMDLLPFPKAEFQYILLAVDAYSQYIMTVPLKDKSGSSALQGILSIFSTMGLYRQLYLDNETSFMKASKTLVKTIPVEIHYSVPYAHHQNSAETTIKNFKKCFIKLLYESKNPKEKTDWCTVLSTVTRSVNRQVILSLGMTRESLHFNSPTEFYPFAHIANESQDELQDAFNTFDKNFYNQLVHDRLKRQSYLNRSKIPIFYEGHLAFIKNQEPAAGSKILKLPFKGPYRVKTITSKNVVLEDLETGKDVTSYYEFIKPLSMKEFRLLLTKGWDSNLNNKKQTQKLGLTPNLDTLLGLTDHNVVKNEEREVVSCSQDENDNFGNTGGDPDNPKSKISNIPDKNKPFDDPRFDPCEGSSSNIENYVEPSLLKSTRMANRFKTDPILPYLRPPPKPNFNFLKLKKMHLHNPRQQQLQHENCIFNQPQPEKAKKVAKSGSLTKRPNVFKSFFT